MPKITFASAQKTESVIVSPGISLLAAADLAQVSISAACGGQGHCGLCRVRVGTERSASDLSDFTTSESQHLGSAARIAGYRLACQAMVGECDLIVYI